MPQNMETLRGATMSTSFSLPIFQAATCGSAAPTPHQGSHSAGIIASSEGMPMDMDQEVKPLSPSRSRTGIYAVEVCLEIFMVHIK